MPPLIYKVGVQSSQGRLGWVGGWEEIRAQAQIKDFIAFIVFFSGFQLVFDVI